MLGLIGKFYFLIEKLLFLVIFISLSCPADSSSGNPIEKTISKVGGDLEEKIYGSCIEEIRERLDESCIVGGSLNHAITIDGLNSEIEGVLKKLNQTLVKKAADDFYARAKNEQSKIISCEMDQLRGLLGVRTTELGNHVYDEKLRSQGDFFIQTVMKDICGKLPALNKLYGEMNSALKISQAAQSAKNHPAFHTLDKEYGGDGKYDYGDSSNSSADEARVRTKANDIALAQKKAYDEKLAKFNAYMISIWKASNPKMEEYIRQQMSSPKPSACIGADSAKGLDVREKFRNQVIGGVGGGIAGLGINFGNEPGMIYQAGLDHAGVGMLNQRGRAVLFERSNDGIILNKKARSGDAMAMVTACRIQKESGGVELLENTALNGSFLVGGLGYFLRAARVASVAANFAEAGDAALATSKLMAASRVFVIGSSGLGLAASALSIQRDCFGNLPSTVYNKSSSATCDQGGNQWASEVETMEKENCALSLVLGGTFATLGLKEAAGLLREGRAAAALARDVAAATARKNAVQDMGGITVTAKKPVWKIAKTPEARAEQIASVQEKVAQVGRDKRLIEEEAREQLRNFSDDVDLDVTDLINGNIDAVLARNSTLSQDAADNLAGVGIAANKKRDELEDLNRRLRDLGSSPAATQVTQQVAQEHAIKKALDEIGRATDETNTLGPLGFKAKTDSPPGIVVYSDGNAEIILPKVMSGRPALRFTPEEKIQLEKILRERKGRFVHSEVSVGKAADSTATAEASLRQKKITENNFQTFFSGPEGQRLANGLSDRERIFLFEHYSGVRLNAADAERFLEVHNIGLGFGAFTREELIEKGLALRSILRANGVTSQNDIMRIIRLTMDNGVAGRAVPESQRTNFLARIFGSGRNSERPVKSVADRAAVSSVPEVTAVPNDAVDVFNRTGAEVLDAARASLVVRSAADVRTSDLFAPVFRGNAHEMIITNAFRDDQLYKGKIKTWWESLTMSGSESRSPLATLYGAGAGGENRVRRTIYWPKRPQVALDSYRVVVNQIEEAGQWVDKSLEAIVRNADGTYRPMFYVKKGNNWVPSRTFKGVPIEKACIKCHHRPPEANVFTAFPFARTGARVDSLAHGYQIFANQMIQEGGGIPEAMLEVEARRRARTTAREVKETIESPPTN